MRRGLKQPGTKARRLGRTVVKRGNTVRRIHPVEEYCIACGLCEVHCAVAHSKSKNAVKAFKHERRPQERIKVESAGDLSWALSCRHCDDAACVMACLAGALTRHPETGVIVIDKEKCVGCWSCIMVCSYGAIQQGNDRKIAVKCDFCKEAEEPACVSNCPNGALILEILE